MTLLLTALAFIILLTGLILIHEWGHFIAARKTGVVVEEFGFGLPPQAKKLFSWGGTLFSLNWIPFGGFVRLKGENAMDEKDRRVKGSFAAAPLWARCLILVSGVAMNFLLAVAIFTIGFSFGKWVPTYTSLEAMQAASARGEITLELAVLIDQVVPGGTAEQAQIPAGSILTAIDGQPVTVSQDVERLQQGKTRVRYTVLTGEAHDQQKDIVVSLDDGKAGVVLQTFPKTLEAPARGVISAFGLSLREAGVVTQQTILGLGHLFVSLFRRAEVPEGITGIVGIAQLTYASVQQGFMVYLRLVALLSLSLAALNILPFPSLDGGRLLFVLLEAVYSRPSTRRIEIFVNTIGFAFLLLLILLVTVYDVIRLF